MTHLLIIGAGPYGLSVAAYAQQRGIDYVLAGKPMGMWRDHMPDGMFLRSPASWHIDPFGVHTFKAFLKERKVNPIPVGLCRDYGLWFIEKAGLKSTPLLVRELKPGFEATLEDGQTITARTVLVATGFQSAMHIPEGMAGEHACRLVSFEHLRGKRCVIVGGRQSAFEWAALIGEQGGGEIHVCYRHDTPRFEPSDWSFTDRMIQSTMKTRGWWRRLPEEERRAIERRFWEEGRLKLEPWLESRIRKPNIHLWPNSDVRQRVAELKADQVILATGFRLDVARMPFLRVDIEARDGFPCLDEDFQSSVPGLFFAGLAASRDFGPFFGFMRACPAAAQIIGQRIERAL